MAEVTMSFNAFGFMVSALVTVIGWAYWSVPRPKRFFPEVLFVIALLGGIVFVLAFALRTAAGA